MEQSLVFEGVDALTGGEGVASETMLDQIANADDSVGRYVVKRLTLALGEVVALAGAIAARWTLAAGAVLGRKGSCRLPFGLVGSAVAVVLRAGICGGRT